MVKHIGKHNDKKVVILFREVPNEEHMCLVCYSDLLPRVYHDSIMKVVESELGQSNANLNEVLFRSLLPDGRNALQTLHKEGLIKKVPCNQVLLTPNSKSSVRLDEINSILKKMTEGGEAVKKMAELDAQTGVRDPKKSTMDQAGSALSDVALSANLQQQAAKMRAEAQGLLAEAARLEQEAQTFAATAQALAPTPVVKKLARRVRRAVQS